MAIGRYIRRAVKYAFPAWLCLLFLYSCSSTRFLEDDQYLLEKNVVKLEGKVAEKRDLSYELTTFYKQRPNTNFLFFFPREWFYFKMQDPNDTTRFDAWKRRAIAEVPAIYSDSLTEETAEQMSLYLQYNGYFNAQVIPQRDPQRQKMKVTYYAVPGKRFMIDSVFFDSSDPTIDSLLQSIKSESYLQTGLPLNLRLFDREKERLSEYMRDNGFANFYTNYIGDLEVDTSQVSSRANLYVNVLPPFGDSVHTQFYIGEVNVFTDFDPEGSNIRLDTSIGGLNFFLSEQGFIVKPSVFREAISLRPGELFSQTNLDETNKRLGDLGIFRFVRIKQESDSIDSQLLHFNIQLTPNFRMEIGADLELNYTNLSINPGTGDLFGLSLSPSLRHRNLLGGAELLATNLSAGVETAPQEIGNDAFWNTVDLRAQADLFLPDFTDYLGFWRGLHTVPLGKNRRLLNSNFYRALRENANTRLSASYNYLLVFQWYEYNLLNVSFGYDFQRSKNTRYIIDHFAVNFLRPIIQDEFQKQLTQNPFLERSFGQQVFVSLLFRELDFLHSSRVNRRGQSTFINLDVETAGTEVWAANAIYNEFALVRDTFSLGKDIDFSQYVRTEVDFRYYKQYTPEQSFASRINFGIARPFGFTSDVPYVKQFFVGGANSMRAWAPRGLGPGGYFDPLSLEPDSTFRLFQSGDIKLELNLEYRFNIFWRLKGAIFLDVGNVWTVQRDDNRPGSQFLWTRRDNRFDLEGNPFVHHPFYKQLAIGSGFGLRVDLSYFLFRFDIGVKLRNSFPDDRSLQPNIPESAWWNDLGNLKTNDFGFNLGLGLPF